MPEQAVLTPTDLAKRWAISRDAVRTLAPSIPGAFKIGRQYRFPIEGVLDYERARRLDAAFPVKRD